MNRAENAVELKHANNCCQSVLLAYADKLGLSEAELKRLGSGFGAGMGCMEATCGALCGAQMVLGLVNTEGRPTIRDAQAIIRAFREKAGATACGELKGVGTGKPLCSCDDCVRYAVECLENQLER